QGNNADAVLISPPGGLSQNLGRRQGQVQLLLDATNVTKAQSIERYLEAITARVLQERSNKIPQAKGITLDTRVLYNPSMDSSIFMVPAVLGMLSCLLPIILTAMAITKEKEEGTFEMLIASPATPTDIILGKTIPYLLLGLAHLPITLPVAHYLFGVPIRGSLIVLLISFLTIIFVTISCGVLISTISRTQQQSMMGAFIFIFPAMMLSGIMFPIENMPAYMKVLTYINPLSYFLTLLRNLMLKGGDPQLVIQSLALLIVISVVVVGFTFNRFKTTIS
ncbi:MAG TPA: ABC transporter permease, partial [Bdellovibrio sp.]|nr:ABC transporter permease [Bdellovibrio sp.]